MRSYKDRLSRFVLNPYNSFVFDKNLIYSHAKKNPIIKEIENNQNENRSKEKKIMKIEGKWR